MQTVMIVGAGKHGMSILNIIQESVVLTVEAVIDLNPEAPGIKWARELGIKTGSDWRPYMDKRMDMIIEVTGQYEVFKELRNRCDKETVLIPSSVAYMLVKLFKDKEKLIKKIRNETYKYNLIFNSTDDGMIVIDPDEKVILLNSSAQKMIGVSEQETVGKHVTISFHQACYHV